MENSIISNFKNEFLKKKLFVLSMWKLTLGYGSAMKVRKWWIEQK
jgi:hypothetical protein